MTTWTTLLADIRTDLQDTNATPRWSNALLFLYGCDAIRDYSVWFPRRTDQSALSLNEAETAYTLPTDFVDVINVECPIGTFLENRNERPGRKYFTSSSATRPFTYHIEGGGLYLNSPPLEGDSVLLTYFAVHVVPASETAATVMTVPDRDLELIRLYVKAQVNIQMRGKQARLDRFKTGAGARDDNPLEPESVDLMQDYYAKIAERISGGAVKLYRPGRIR